MHCLNFSIRNDKTQNILWRVINGELDNVKPKVIFTILLLFLIPFKFAWGFIISCLLKFNLQIVVLHVGTNNVNDAADNIAAGIIEIVKVIRAKLPETYIILPVSYQLDVIGYV